MSSPSYLSREALSALLLQPAVSRPSVAIIDVRDDDHVGGHILGSTHVPSSTFDYQIPTLVRTLKDKDVVVFHCALSQQRGPAAARRYLSHVERELDKANESDKEQTTAAVEVCKEGQRVQKQQVYVLDGGFVKWQEM
jgi:Cdc25 family phosphatase